VVLDTTWLRGELRDAMHAILRGGAGHNLLIRAHLRVHLLVLFGRPLLCLKGTGPSTEEVRAGPGPVVRPAATSQQTFVLLRRSPYDGRGASAPW